MKKGTGENDQRKYQYRNLPLAPELAQGGI